MTWHPSDELERLLNGLTDAVLSEEEELRLATILQNDPDARRYYRHWMALHADLMWDYAAAVSAPATPSEAKSTRTRWQRSRWWVAASVAFLAALPMLWNLAKPGNRSAIARVDEVQGAVSWNNGTGEPSITLSSGQRVAGGTIFLEGEAASAQLQFDDGTRITLNGDSELSFSDHGQKHLALRRGTLGAEVQPQPPGRPMLVRTPTAQIEVVGTVFGISTRSNETELNVETGRVTLRGLVDGKNIDVAATQSAIASLATTELVLQAAKAPPEQWRATFEQPSPSAKDGLWLAPVGDMPGRVAANPYVAGRRPDDTPVIHHGVTFKYGDTRGGFVTLTQETVIRVRYRCAREVPMICFLSCQLAKGGFGGNFDILERVPNSAPDANGWREHTFSISRARALDPKRFPSPVGTRVRAMIVLTIEEDVGLEVAEVEVGPRKGE